MNSKNKYYIEITLVIVIIFLFFLIYSFIGDIRRLHTNGVLTSPNYIEYLHYPPSKPATLADINIIEPWMTFGYINKLFNLPADYLKTELNIGDKSYPRLVISKIAKEKDATPSAYLEKVKSSVADYLSKNTPTQ